MDPVPYFPNPILIFADPDLDSGKKVQSGSGHKDQDPKYWVDRTKNRIKFNK